MLIVCPSCTTSYRVEPASLGTTGRPVRCIRCRTIWFARTPGALSAVARDFRNEAGVLPSPDEPSDSAVLESAAEGAPDALEAGTWDQPTATASTFEAASSQTGSTNDIWTEQTPPDHLMAAEHGVTAHELSASDASAVRMWTDRAVDQAVLGSVEQPLDATSAAPDRPMAAPGSILAGEWPMTDIQQLSATPVVEGQALAADVESIAARRAPRTPTRHRFYWPLSGLSTAIVVLLVLNVALIAGRAQVVRFLPQTASLYAAIGLPVNLRGLAFSKVATTTETQEGVPVLMVEGTIANAGNRAVEVPRLRFSVRNDSGQEVYAWTAMPSRSVLGPGETVEFRSRLASPPSEARDVLVRFFNRRDRLAGVQ